MIVERDVAVPMRDDVRLAADVYRPATHGKWPVLLERTPYGKHFRSAELFLNFQRAVGSGFAVVVQDCRGRYASDGVWSPLHCEIADGSDTVDWCASQLWSNGRVGMFGGSGHGKTQWLAAKGRPQSLRVIAPVSATASFSESWFYRTGGVFCLNSSLGWALWVSAHSAQRKGLLDSYFRELLAAYEATMDATEPAQAAQARRTVVRMLSGEIASCRPLAAYPRLHSVAPWFYEWLNRPNPGDEYWKSVQFTQEDANNSRIATLQITGWYDFFLGGVLPSFAKLSGQLHRPTFQPRYRVVIGPWDHSIARRTPRNVGEIDFGPTAEVDLEEIQLDWYHRWLKEPPAHTVEEEAPIQIFVMGRNQWRSEWEWPLRRTKWTSWFLHSRGNANTAFGDGVLVDEPQESSPSDAFTHDPANPVPTVGGVVHPNCLDAGPRDQRIVEERSDVLVYTSRPLARPLEVSGPVRVMVYASSSAPDTDLMAKLVDVFDDGRAICVCEGAVRAAYRSGSPAEMLRPGQIHLFSIDLWVTSCVFFQGHRVRLEIASSSFPHFEPNTGAGRPFAEVDYDDMRSANQTIFHTRELPSRLELPVIDA